MLQNTAKFIVKASKTEPLEQVPLSELLCHGLDHMRIVSGSTAEHDLSLSCVESKFGTVRVLIIEEKAELGTKDDIAIHAGHSHAQQYGDIKVSLLPWLISVRSNNVCCIVQ